MKEDIAIQVEGLSKLYYIGKAKTQSESLAQRFRGGILASARRLGVGGQSSAADETIWALRDVSFDVKHGEAVGIIGPNGAGKSTLLKLLSGLTAPTEGRISIRGRIGSMLEIGTGFHPELSGRENIFLNGVILGMKRTEIESKFDRIVAFSGVERFLDMPVKRYSSGMRVRLAFSVIAHLEPEILLIDEVLSVGDVAFRRKSMRKMEDLIRGGRTVVFVSHNAKAISDLCDWTMMLYQGRVAAQGPSDEVVQAYLEQELGQHAGVSGKARFDPDPSKEMCLRNVMILNHEGKSTGTLELDKPFRVRISYDVNRPVHSADVMCLFRTSDGVAVLGTGDADCESRRLGERLTGSYTAEFQVPESILAPGSYLLGVNLSIPFERYLDRHESVLDFTIVDPRSTGRLPPRRRRPGIVGLTLPWEYQGAEPAGDVPEEDNPNAKNSGNPKDGDTDHYVWS
jgi:lipopolysaccharide transport system ATP-binding protein